MKRFWREVVITPAEDGYAVGLDGKMLHTPKGRACVCPTAALAEAVAAEWRAVTDKVNPRRMPMMQMTATALDIVPDRRADVIDQIAAYTVTDLLCYRAAEPLELAALQQREWQPWLDWAAERFNAVLKIGIGIAPVLQEPQAVQALRQAVAALDAFRLTALQGAVQTTGSLILGLALLEGWRDADAVFDAAELDAAFQLQRWGAEPEALARRLAVREELDGIARFVGALQVQAIE